MRMILPANTSKQAVSIVVMKFATMYDKMGLSKVFLNCLFNSWGDSAQNLTEIFCSLVLLRVFALDISKRLGHYKRPLHISFCDNQEFTGNMLDIRLKYLTQ